VLREVDNGVEVLFLQHPQEPDRTLGSARIAALCLQRSTLTVGLSWANLSDALGRSVDARSWGVLYLGSGLPQPTGPGLRVLGKDNTIDNDGLRGLEGIVVLDGTWSQAKALWWRNAWLLKLRRLVLTPSRPSLYGRLRREPRRECLSTLEATAEALTFLGAPPAVGQDLRAVFGTLLQRARDVVAEAEAKPARRGPGASAPGAAQAAPDLKDGQEDDLGEGLEGELDEGPQDDLEDDLDDDLDEDDVAEDDLDEPTS
jgi:DTW domain-containing protein YfiP